MGPAESINAVEVALRDLIEQVLGEKFGVDWINECGTPEKIQQWRERRIQEAKQRDATVAEERLIYYSDFTDLGPIIKRHWELFKACLDDQRTFLVYMERLEDFRNAPMHSRALVPFEQALVEGMTGEIRNKVTIYRSQVEEVDRHFPRMEFARDSFGNVADPNQGLTKTGITLYPGDKVVFECAGWDPLGQPLKWTLQTLPGTTRLPGSPLLECEGPGARFAWDVTEANIAASCFVVINLMSDRSWHRTAGRDDQANFIYAVLPR
jgi:HEPN superfamily Swt1-like protein